MENGIQKSEIRKQKAEPVTISNTYVKSRRLHVAYMANKQFSLRHIRPTGLKLHQYNFWPTGPGKSLNMAFWPKQVIKSGLPA